MFFFILFKQKTAYELRISDWSSDVCSSDLAFAGPDGDVRLSGGAPVDSELRWRSGSLQVIAFGAATLPWRRAGAALRSRAPVVDGKRVGRGKRVSVRVDTGGLRRINTTIVNVQSQLRDIRLYHKRIV